MWGNLWGGRAGPLVGLGALAVACVCFSCCGAIGGAGERELWWDWGLWLSLMCEFFSCSAVSGAGGQQHWWDWGFWLSLMCLFFPCGAISGAKEGRTTDGTGGLGNRLHVKQSLEANLWRDQGEEDRLRRKRQRK